MYDNRKMPSKEERNAATKIQENIRFMDGAYEVSVPWKDDNVIMPNNQREAKARIEVMRRSFLKKPADFSEYNAVIHKYIEDGHAESVLDTELITRPGKKYYLLHHAVKHLCKQSKRVVFNASKKYQGLSVNDRIMSCPDKLERLIGLLIRFREGLLK